MRLIQLRREAQTLGWIHKLLFLVLLLVFMAVSHNVSQKAPACWAVPGALWVSAVMAQLFRPDKDFVFLHIRKPAQEIFLEYAAFSLPFILPILFSPNWYCFPVYFIGLWPISFLRKSFPSQARFVFLGRLFPPTAFEWISGFRQASPVFVIGYLTAIAFCWVKALPLFLLWLLNLLFVSFYQECEPLNLLRAFADTPEELLRKKLLLHGKILLWLNVPVLALQAVFHPVIGLAGIIFLLLQLITLAFTIFLKYATYRPNMVVKSNTLLISLSQMGVIFPFLLPLPLVMCFRYYKRAKLNLIHFLPA
ncbi:hypothetical protein [Adhaeribacter soli]|uniref:Uncharacterized protein n=1 Tax=Adhaeribacter soli TaxID=2607655 RepID=A0A5N1IRJ3_9BACT|nr:hypothetical protein [Adhaeribacter soli]KAA9332785.1 hypothetical protein F0P94_12365 [Adhaeribacter soli]